MRLAAIKNSVVENVIAVTSDNFVETTASLQAQGFVCVQTDTAGPGWTYNGSVFSPPVEPVEPVADPCADLIDIGPFFDRFGALKIAILSDPDMVVQAIVKDVMARKWVTLTRPDVAQAVDIIIAKGHAVNKATVLSTPVLPDENLALRKLYF